MSKPVVLLDAGQLVGLSGTADGDVLTWNGTLGQWQSAPGGGVGTVTSVALSTGSTGLTVSGGTSQTITGSGTFSLAGTLGAGYGGTGLGAPAGGDAGKVLTATAGGGYELTTPAATGVTSVSASSPLASSGGTTPTISLSGTVGAANGGTGLGAPVAGDAGKVLAATAGGGYELVTNGNGTVTSITAGTGLDGGTITTSGTISMPNVGTAGTYGSASSVPVITTDAQGRVSSVTPTSIAIAQSAVTDLVADLASKVPTSRTVSTTSGQLTGGGALSSDLTLGLATVGTAASNQGSATQTVTLSTDAYGRVTSLSAQAIAGLDAGVITTGTLPLIRGGTGINASVVTEGQLLVGTSPAGAFALQSVSKDATLGADGALTVTGWQGRAVSSAAPIAGQTMVWSTAGGGSWVPGDTASGGSGGGGVVYFMNAGTSRTGGGLPIGTYQLGRTAEVSASPITVTNVATGGWTRVAGFVSDAGDPSIVTLPAGVWDFNTYATSTAGANDMTFRLSFYAYDGTTNPELGSALATTLSTAIYDPSVATQYQSTFNLGPTAFTGKRLYIKLEVQAASNNKNATFDFGDSFASHVHTTVPSVTGSGFVKVLNDVIMSTGQLVDLSTATDVGSSVLGVTNGGTGAATLPAGQVLTGNGTSTIASIAMTTPGSLLIGGSGGPSAQTLTGSTGVSVTNGNNSITVAIGQAVATTDAVTFANITDSGLTASQYVKTNSSKQLVSSATIAAADLSGTVALANGGTNASLTATAGGVAYSDASALALTAAGTSGQVLKSNGASAPSWADLSSLGVSSITGTTNQIDASASTGAVTLSLPSTLVLPSGTTATTQAVDNNTTSVATTAYVVGQGYLKSATAALTYAPLTSPTFSGTFTITGLASGLVRSTSGVLSGAGTVALGSEVTGALPVANGGTNLTSYAVGDLLYASGTTTLSRLADVAAGNALISGGVGVAPSWGKIGLTTHVSGTLAVGNGGTGATTLTQYGVLVGAGTGAVQATAAGTSSQYLKSGAGAANPAFATIAVAEVTGAAPTASPTFTGTVTLPLTTAGYVKTTSGGVISSSASVPTSDLSGSVALGSQVSGTLPIANGGTNNGSLVVTQGTVYYGDGTKLIGLAPGTSGQFLQTQGAGANPQWASAGSATTPYDLMTYFPGSPGASLVLGEWFFPRAATISATTTDHLFYSDTLPASGTVVLTVKKLPTGSSTKVNVFTVTWTAGQAAALNGKYLGVVGTVSNNTVALGDGITIETGATVNASLTNIGMTIKASV